jgi:hypothetical protein
MGNAMSEPEIVRPVLADPGIPDYTPTGSTGIDSELRPTGLIIHDVPIIYLLSQRIIEHCRTHPWTGDRTRPAPCDVLFHRGDDGKLRVMQPTPEILYLSVEILDSPQIIGLTFENGLLYIKDNCGEVLNYQPMYTESYGLMVVCRKIKAGQPTPPTTSREGDHAPT